MYVTYALTRWLKVKNSPANAKDARDIGLIPVQEESLEEDMATHSSILTGKTSWTEESGGLKPKGSEKTEHYLVHEHAHTVNPHKRTVKISFGISISPRWLRQ